MKNATARYRAMVEVIEPYRDYDVFASKWSDNGVRRKLTSDFRTLKVLHDEAAGALEGLAEVL